jgi:type I restriction enzyme S subunit
MNVLLSVKPEFAEKILTGEKRYEFRKTTFRDPDNVDTVFLYASSPEQEIVGSFSFDDITQADPEELWDRYGAESGIEQKSRFMDYFKGTTTGYAIAVDETMRFASPIDPYRRFDGFRPPVSFQYFDPHRLLDDAPQSASD